MIKEVQPKARTMGVDMLELTLLPNVKCSCRPFHILYHVEAMAELLIRHAPRGASGEAGRCRFLLSLPDP